MCRVLLKCRGLRHAGWESRLLPGRELGGSGAASPGVLASARPCLPMLAVTRISLFRLLSRESVVGTAAAQDMLDQGR